MGVLYNKYWQPGKCDSMVAEFGRIEFNNALGPYQLRHSGELLNFSFSFSLFTQWG